jgi:hypothetical protein
MKVKVFDLWLACSTQDEIAEQVGLEQRTVSNTLDEVLEKKERLPNFLKFNFQDDLNITQKIEESRHPDHKSLTQKIEEPIDRNPDHRAVRQKIEQPVNPDHGRGNPSPKNWGTYTQTQERNRPQTSRDLRH